ncbi:hypothetical protein QUF56_09935 [Ureibacillus composti]|nr:hypothetical protein [Ureibacillus composti]
MRLVYQGKTQQGYLYFLAMVLLLTISNIKLDGYDEKYLYIQIVVCTFTLLTVCFRFKFTIYEKKLTYRIELFIFQIYQKEIGINEIKQIKFTRVGWAKKGAIVKVIKGFNIRIFDFEPNHVYTDLLEFANNNSITIIKTKDYLILEKRK